MKKIAIYLTTLILIFGFLSCQKQIDNEPASPNYSLEEYSRGIISKIKNFDDKITGSYKSGERLSLDSAVWNVEALINFDHAYPDSSARDFVFHKHNYTLILDGFGEVSLVDVIDMYDEIESDYAAGLNSIEGNYKNLRFADVAVDSLQGSTAYLSATMGYGIDWVQTGWYSGFEDDDHWIWGTPSEPYGQPPAGKCDETMIGVSDGSNELVRRLNNPLISIDQRYKLIDMVTITDVTGFEWMDENGNPLLFAGYVGLNHCLYHNDLTTYLSNSHNIIYNSGENGVRPEGLTFGGVQILDDIVVNENADWYLHNYSISYGTLILMGEPD